MRKIAFLHTLFTFIQIFLVDIFTLLLIKIIIKMRKIAFLHTLFTFIQIFLVDIFHITFN